MKNFIKIIAYIVFVNVVLISCNPINSENVSDKILITDSLGNIIGGNFNQWCLADSNNQIYAKPPYPNPVSDTLNIEISNKKITYSDIRIFFEDGQEVVNQRITFFGTRRYKISKSDYGYNNELKLLTIQIDSFICQGYIQF
ncbi:MAG: hypothetical protein IAE65_11435 [Ignavibacteria bacterium]|nr:hypothetical protein [Ignavibacteria bacterium]